MASSLKMRVRNWAFTSFATNEKNELIKPTFIKDKMRYLLFAPEVCPNTGKQHYQGFVQFNKATLGTTIITKKYLPQNASLHGCNEKRKNIVKDNKTYIIGPYDDGKGKQKPYNDKYEEFGEAIEQGHRTDLGELLANNNSFQECMASNPELTVKYHNGIRACYACRGVNYKPTDEEPIIYWYWGENRKNVKKLANELIIKLNKEMEYDAWEMPLGNNFWFDSYVGQEIAYIPCIDATRVSSMALFTRLLEGNVQVQCKGGFNTFNPKVIILTSTPHPININFRGTSMKDRNDLIDNIQNIITYMETSSLTYNNKQTKNAIEQKPETINKIQCDIQEEFIEPETEEIITEEGYDSLEEDNSYEESQECWEISKEEKIKIAIDEYLPNLSNIEKIQAIKATINKDTESLNNLIFKDKELLYAKTYGKAEGIDIRKKYNNRIKPEELIFCDKKFEYLSYPKKDIKQPNF